MFQNFFSFPRVLSYLIIFIVSFPIISFFIRVGNVSFPIELTSYLYFTFLQATLSTGLSFLVALGASLGLIYFYKKPYYFFLEWMYWLPIFLPSIVISGSIINILETVGINPFGLLSIVTAHTLIYSGGLSVIITRLTLSKASSYFEWAQVHGISSLKFLRVLVFGVLRKDIQLALLTVFGFCVTSFSVPVLLGDFQNQTLEVAIYRYLKDSNWPFALGLLLIEILILFILSLFIFKGSTYLKNLKPIKNLGIKPFILFGAIPSIVVLIGCIEGLFYIPQIVQVPRFFEAFLTTLFLSLAVGFGTIFLFTLIFLCYSSSILPRFLIGYMAPSIVLTGFSFLMLGDHTYFSWVLGLMILFTPTLYRWIGDALLSSLRSQIQVAQTLGASLFDIFKNIIWPQSYQLFFMIGGVVSFWAAGDFAYTMITSQGETNLALMAQKLLGRYKIEYGLSMIWIILFVGSFCFLFFNYFLKKVFKNDY